MGAMYTSMWMWHTSWIPSYTNVKWISSSNIHPRISDDTIIYRRLRKLTVDLFLSPRFILLFTKTSWGSSDLYMKFQCLSRRSWVGCKRHFSALIQSTSLFRQRSWILVVEETVSFRALTYTNVPKQRKEWYKSSFFMLFVVAVLVSSHHCFRTYIEDTILCTWLECEISLSSGTWAGRFVVFW